MKRLVDCPQGWFVPVMIGCVSLLIGGCASLKEVTRTPSHSRVFDAAYEQVWGAAGHALTGEAYGVSSVNRERGLIIAERHYPASDLPLYTADSLEPSSAPWWSLEVTLIISVESLTSQQTRLSVDPKYMGRISQIVPTAKRSGLTIVPLRSNGTLEQRILDAVATHLQHLNLQSSIPRTRCRLPLQGWLAGLAPDESLSVLPDDRPRVS